MSITFTSLYGVCPNQLVMVIGMFFLQIAEPPECLARVRAGYITSRALHQTLVPDVCYLLLSQYEKSRSSSSDPPTAE